jgi:hypothetical protein
MKRIITVLSAMALVVGLFAGSALALTDAQQARKAACEAIDPGPNVVATYVAGSPAAAGQNDTCTVVSTATTLEESIEQVNNPRAAKAVVRVSYQEKTVTTTQLYMWDIRAVAAGGQKWVAEGDPVLSSPEYGEIVEECMRTPGIDKCA